MYRRQFFIYNIVAAFRGMYCVACETHQESVTSGQTQTDGQTPDKVIPVCRYASQATQKSHYIQCTSRSRHFSKECSLSLLNVSTILSNKDCTPKVPKKNFVKLSDRKERGMHPFNSANTTHWIISFVNHYHSGVFLRRHVRTPLHGRGVCSFGRAVIKGCLCPRYNCSK